MTLRRAALRWRGAAHLKLAEARLRHAEAACRAMRMGPFYDCAEDDSTYYGNIVALHDARDAVKAARESHGS